MSDSDNNDRDNDLDNGTPWNESVQGELMELTERMVKLRRFIATGGFHDLPGKQQRLLIDQSHAMAQYADILAARLELHRRPNG